MDGDALGRVKNAGRKGKGLCVLFGDKHVTIFDAQSVACERACDHSGYIADRARMRTTLWKACYFGSMMMSAMPGAM